MRIDPYRSKEERLFASLGKPVIESLPEFQGGVVETMTYEAVTLSLGGAKYTPDFYIVLNRGDCFNLVLVEVKGSKKQRGYQTSKTRLNTAVGLYPEFVFVMFFVSASKSTIYEWDVVTKPPFMRFTYGKDIGT